jgi:hypothetical protein
MILARLKHCNNLGCLGHHKTQSPEEEIFITQPAWLVGWDVFAWIGQRRFARHWSVGEIRNELATTHKIFISEDAIENYIKRYQCLVAAYRQDPAVLKEEYADTDHLVLSIDGLQPEKGHETLYVVREISKKRVWFAETLVSSSAAEVRRLLEKALDWVKCLGVPVKLWISDKQNALVTAIAEVFPGVPHRYCSNHFLRDLAKPVLETDGHAKVEMRKKVRGLRGIEKDILARKKIGGKRKKDAREQVVMDYCAATRGVLNDDQGGPINPPGLRMAKGLKEIQASIKKNVDAKKGGSRTRR